METTKKPTNGQLTKKIQNALVFVEKDKNYKSVFFDDKMLKLETTSDYCVVSTGYHRHVFDAINPNQSGGYSRPYLYTRQIIDLANEYAKIANVKVMTYEAFLDFLNQKEDKSLYNIATYYSWWLFNIFQPLYQIWENEIDAFITYESFLHNIARSTVILSEKTEDVTNKQFVSLLQSKENEYFEGMQENVLFHKMTDEEAKQKEIDALNEISDEQTILNNDES